MYFINKLTVEASSSAVKVIPQCRGVGKIRHLHCPLLWIQQKVYAQELNILRMRGEINTPDPGHQVSGCRRHVEYLACSQFWEEGRFVQVG